MKIKFVGIVLIVIGFTIPFVLKEIVPTFMYAAILSQICFWFGLYTILTPIHPNSIYTPYLRWARYGVLLNFGLSFFAIAFGYMFLYFGLDKIFGVFLIRLLFFLTNPIQSTFDFFAPNPMVLQPDESFIGTISFIRALLIEFFNILFFCCVGVLAKIIKEKITRPRNGSPGHPAFEHSGVNEYKPSLRQVSGSPGSHWRPPFGKPINIVQVSKV